MASSPKEQCTEFNSSKYSTYELVFTQQVIIDALNDKTKPISLFIPIIEEHLNKIIEGIISKRFKRSEQAFISGCKAIALIDTDYPDIVSTIPHVDELFDEKVEQSKRDMLFDFLGSCQLDIKLICDMNTSKCYFIFLVNRAMPMKIMFLGYFKSEPDVHQHVFIDNLIRDTSSSISKTYSQQRKKETSIYRNKVVLLPI